jgi:hypothetical protein
MNGWAIVKDYWLNRKNCWVSEIGLVTIFCALTTTGAGEAVAQTIGSARFVAVSKLKLGAHVGHDRRT